MENCLKVMCHDRAHGRNYTQVVEFDCKKYFLKRNSWLRQVLLGMSRESAVVPGEGRGIRAFKNLLDQLVLHFPCVKYLQMDVALVGRREAAELFTMMEDALLETRHLFARSKSDRTLVASSGAFRRYMCARGKDIGFREELSVTAIPFKSRWKTKRSGRVTLSDHVAVNSRGESIPPVDAYPHKDVKTLREVQLARLRADAAKPISSYTEELEFWAGVRSKIEVLSKNQFSPDEINIVKNFVLGRKREHFQSPIPLERFIGAIAYLGGEPATAPVFQRLGFNGASAKDQIGKYFDISPGRWQNQTVMNVLLITQRMTPRELAAAFGILLFHSAWNSDSLRMIEREWIQLCGDGYQIVSSKPKTGAVTPDVFIDSENQGGRAALELLIWNHARQKELGLISENEAGVWFSWPRKNHYPQTKQYSQIHVVLNVLNEFYGIPHFSMDQVRTHMLTIASYAGSFMTVPKEIAGHRNLHTTGGYLEQVVREKFGKAVNLEFQRRIENTVIFQLETIKSFPRRPKQEFVDVKLLVDVGDGTSCIDPQNPPDGDWRRKSGFCDGTQCHVRDGCKNNRIVVTEDRVEEVFRLQKFYQAHWLGLLEKNNDAFEKFHAPVMLFNIALIHYFKASIYWPEIEKIKNRVLG